MKNYDVLNELVPKTQELHREIFDKGYEQGFKDGTNAEYEYDHAFHYMNIKSSYKAESEEEE